jgi:hypothetical protein
MNEIYSHQQRIRLGLLNESVELFEKKLTDDEIDKILKKLHAEDEAELEKMNEEYDDDFSDCLNEEEEKVKKASSDTKGKLHEILTGYHLQGGKHMEKHPDKNGDSPQEAHDKLKKTIHPKEYEKINARAKSAAADIKKKVEVDGHKIKHVHWTSQPNDLLRTTGIKATQKDDASDVVVTTHKKEKAKSQPTVKHHGISLKVTDSSSKHVPTSNLGIKAAGPKAQETHDEHRRAILKKYPKLATHATNAEQRKAMLKSDPKMHEFVKKKNSETLDKIAGDLSHHLNTIPKHELVHHIRNVIHAHQTPMQKQGHAHIRHVSYTAKGTFQHHSMDPSQHHEHILNDPHKIEVEHHGTSIHFKHNGKTFARHAIKFSSQSDPLSSVKGSGQTSGD